MRWTLFTATLAAASVLAIPTAFADQNSARFSLRLVGEIEVPVPGDPDGTGRAVIRIGSGGRQLCYTLVVRGIEPATAAHIHEAPAGEPGPIVVPLNAPTNGTSNGCVPIDRQQAQDIIRNPADYYINVHNAEYPGGALRAQLDM